MVNVFLNDGEKIFIFKFEKRVMGGRSDQAQVQELVPRQIYMFELDALYVEDIILDMRDRIVSQLLKAAELGTVSLSDELIDEIEGKMEFFVRRAVDSRWQWQSVNDFDRVEKFPQALADEDEGDNEIIFKLIRKKGTDGQILDERPDHMLEGYDCFSIYKHSDNSYEWRLCKIVGKELRPEFKSMALEAFFDIQDSKAKTELDAEAIANREKALKEFG